VEEDDEVVEVAEVVTDGLDDDDDDAGRVAPGQSCWYVVDAWGAVSTWFHIFQLSTDPADPAGVAIHDVPNGLLWLVVIVAMTPPL
jgi:hypothetical protein